MIVDWQYEPIKDTLLHIDLKRIALDKRCGQRAVKLMGIPTGVKNSGGILDQVLREVEIECLPATFPATSMWMSPALNARRHPRQRSAALDKIKFLNCRRRDRGPRCLDPRRS
jgi:hypothetical protein